MKNKSINTRIKMKFNSYMYLLTFMSIISAHDDNPSGHELIVNPVGVDDNGILFDDHSNDNHSNHTNSITLDDSSSTTSVSVSDSQNSSNGIKHVLGLVFLFYF